MEERIKAKHKYVLHTLNRYWPHNQEAVIQLPIPEQQPQSEESLPPDTITVLLPEWAYDLGMRGKLLIPAQAITSGEQSEWQRTDWIAAIFWYLNGSAERTYEKLYGTVHSYSFRLRGWDTRLWQRAWVNRIALFLRRWAARMVGQDENKLFGPLPEPEVILTHDVDATQKTVAIRAKQCVFYVVNAVRSLLQGQISKSAKRLGKAGHFLFSWDDYWCFDRTTILEKQYGVRSYFNVYGGEGGWQRTPKQLLFDPAYDVLQPKLRQLFRQLLQDGWTIGLHQSYEAWEDAGLMRREKERLEQALDAPVTTCRQHWLRFSWEQTWQAQQEAGFELDTSLGFNDRPSFRNGAALCFHPWDANTRGPMNLTVLPMVLMDSHLYDYGDLEEDERHRQTDYWLEEIKAVRGTATLIWHQRVMSEDYGWGAGYEYLLKKYQF